ncbi:HK97 gp10 family phage protein [Endozoicomonas gorgoniicola]|uniref:HK97 gp10 family phage protein n=1 Tax=Endozoicomonas gorgoniicola TaxID=1234144 RepID=A0ABT3MWA9_9GAMM|nr:HK97-gp10 family putative phage morphogenesis protein [Endozoicomonas gorgoniicola]MCW7553653.1 HK97 gp10 family phage protein [Endozoicomonas gorgoniicola]
MLKALTVDMTGDRQFRKALEQTPGTLFNQLKRMVTRGGSEAARELKRSAPKAHSTLVNSIRSIRDADLSAIAAPNTDYAQFVNDGTGSGGAPSLQAIKDWIRVKGITPNNPNHDLDDLAYMISRSIARKGTRAQPFVDNTADKLTPRINQLMQQAVRNSLAEVGLL